VRLFLVPYGLLPSLLVFLLLRGVRRGWRWSEEGKGEGGG
jgi:hypothetical protein